MNPSPNQPIESLKEPDEFPFPMSRPGLPSDVQTLESQVRCLAITAPDLRRKAAHLLIAVSSRRKREEDALAIALVKPLAEVKRVREPFNFLIGALESLENYVKLKIKEWDNKELREAREKQAKENQRIAEENQRRAATAQEKGLPPPMMKAPNIAQVTEATIGTEEGSMTRKLTKDWTIHGCSEENPLDKKVLSKIPANDPRLADVDRAYLILNVELLDKLVPLGQPIKGLFIFDTVKVTTRRK